MASSFKIFAAILFVTESERQAVMDMYDWKPFRSEAGGKLWYKTTIERDSNPLTIVAAQTEEKGNPAAAALTSEIIYQLRPQYLFMVGIAAGVQFTHKEKQPQLCDVVLADRVWNLAKGKYVSSEGPGIGLQEDQGFIPKPVVHKIDPDFRATLKEAIKNWKSDIPVHIGAFASGSAVVASAKVINENVLPIIEKTKGLDMESYGVVYTALHASSPRPQPILAKGISDFANSAKSDDCQVKAAANSCSLAKYLIMTLPLREDEKSLVDYIAMRMMNDKDGNSNVIKPKRMYLYALAVWLLVIAVMLLCKLPLLPMILATAGIGILAVIGATLLGKADRTMGMRLQAECSTAIENSQMQAASDIRKQILARSDVKDRIDISGNIVHAAVAGCDMYSWHCSDDRHLWIYVSDTSGKGIEATAFMSRATTGIRSLAMTGTGLETIAATVNRMLCDGNANHHLTNALIGTLDLETDVFTYLNAGESIHFIKGADGKTIQFEPSGNKALGIDADATFTKQEVQLSKGDIMLLCSIGVTRIRNHDGEQFSAWRVERYLSSIKEETADSIVDGLREDILSFTEKNPREQDFTTIAVRICI